MDPGHTRNYTPYCAGTAAAVSSTVYSTATEEAIYGIIERNDPRWARFGATFG